MSADLHRHQCLSPHNSAVSPSANQLPEQWKGLQLGFGRSMPTFQHTIEGQPSRDCTLGPCKCWYAYQEWMKRSLLPSLLPRHQIPQNCQPRGDSHRPTYRCCSASCSILILCICTWTVPCRDRGQSWMLGGVKKREAEQGTTSRGAGNWDCLLGRWEGG